MPFIITDPCIETKDTACVDVCPVDCIHPRKDEPEFAQTTMGLPTPNVFAGEHNFHSRLEWVSVQDMEKAVEVIVEICRVWEERSA